VKQKTLACPECGNKQRIWRKSRRNKAAGHIKHMWCYKCKAVTGHIEQPEHEVGELCKSDMERILRR